MFTASVSLSSVSPYSQSKYPNVPKDKNEDDHAYEERIWRLRCHTNGNGQIVIPAMAFKKSLMEAALYRADKIKGKGMKTWGAKFKAGVLVVDDLPIDHKVADIQGEWLFMDAQGNAKAGKRVMRCYPVIPQWEGTLAYHVMDDTITEEVLETHLKTAGLLIGIGRWRVINGGLYGRYQVDDVKYGKIGIV